MAPGSIATDFGSGTERDYKEFNPMITCLTSISRVGFPDDIRSLSVFLCTDKNPAH
jgi:hypothetical protein